MNRTEKINAVIDIMTEYFTMPDFAVIHDDYSDMENSITEIHGEIQPMDGFDDMLESLDMTVYYALKACYRGKFNPDDDACWYDASNHTINSCSRDTFLNWVNGECFAEYILNLGKDIKKYGLNEDVAEAIMALSRERDNNDILYLVEKDGKTEIMDNLGYGKVKGIFHIYTNYCESADITYVMAENLMDDSNNLEVVNYYFGKDEEPEDGYTIYMAKRGIMRLFG